MYAWVWAQAFCCLVGNLHFYVSSTGSDAGNGSLAQPWATVQHAASMVRGSLGQTNVEVTLSGDLWNQTLSLTDADSGTAAHPVTWDSAVGGSRLIGGVAVAGWTAVGGGVYKASIQNVVWTMSENGVRGVLARTPNYVHDPDWPQAFGPWITGTASSSGTTVFGYSTGDIDPTPWPVGDTIVAMFGSGGLWNWFWNATPAASFDLVGHTITLTQHTQYPLFQSVGSRSFIQGPLALLDAPGEFYVDQATKTLYYYPRATPIGAQEIMVPTTMDVIRIVGADGSHLAHDITIGSGLEIDSSDFVQWYRYGTCWGLSAGTHDPLCDSNPPHTVPGYGFERTNDPNRHGQIYLSNTGANIKIVGNRFLNAGLNAIYSENTSTGITVDSNLIQHAGHSGVFFEGNWPGEGDICHGHTITNNVIEYVGETARHGAGLWYLQCGGTTASRNEISHGSRDCNYMSSGGAGETRAQAYTVGNVIDKLWCHDVGQDSSDMGALGVWAIGSVTGGPYNQNTWSNVLVDRVVGNTTLTDAGPVAVFPDDLTYGQIYTNIDVVNGATFRTNSGEHVTTNVAWVGGFNRALIDYTTIGINRSSFPWLAWQALNFSDDFESGTSKWTAGQGSFAATTNHAHSPTHGLQMSADGSVAYHLTEGLRHEAVPIWFYDDATQTSMEAMTRVDEEQYTGGATFDSWNNTAWRGMGVDTSASTDHYIVRIDSTKTVTSLARSTGWHVLIWDYRGGQGPVMTFDGVPFYTASLVQDPTKGWNMIAVGDWTASDGRTTAGAAWDDVSVTP